MPTLIAKSRTLKFDYASFPNKEQVSYAQYKLIISTFNMILMESMITTGGIYKLPKGVGTLGVFKKHQEYKPLNYQHFKETGELIPLANLHSSKYIFKFSWLKHTAFRHMGANTYVSDAIKFRPARYFTRRLAYNIKNNLNIIAFRDRNDYKIR